MTTYPNPSTIYPIEGVTRTVYLKNIITNPQTIVGDYTYYDDTESHEFNPKDIPVGKVL